MKQAHPTPPKWQYVGHAAHPKEDNPLIIFCFYEGHFFGVARGAFMALSC